MDEQTDNRDKVEISDENNRRSPECCLLRFYKKKYLLEEKIDTNKISKQEKITR